MNNRKTIIYLLVGILALVAAHLYLSFGGGVKLRVRDTVLDRSMLGADKIVIERRGEAGVVLSGKDGAWRVLEPYMADASLSGVARILDALVLYKIEETFTDGELARFGKRRSDFGLADPAVKVSVSKGAETVHVSLGRKTPAGDGVFASIEGDAMTYVLDPRVRGYVDIPSDALRSRALTRREPGPVNMFDVKRGHGVLMRFSKVDGGWKRCADREGAVDSPASSAKIDEFLGALAKAAASAFVWPVGATNEPPVATAPLLAGYGLDPESGITITIRDRGLPPSQIVLGKEAGGGLVYALVQNSTAIVTVDGKLKDMALESDFTDSRIFPYEPSFVTRIALTDGGVDYLLAKKRDGAWVMDAPVSAPADPAEVELLIGRILSATAKDRAADGVGIALATNAPAEKISRSAVLDGFDMARLRSREMARFDYTDIRRIVSSTADGPVASVVYDRDRRAWAVESSKSGSAVRLDAIETVLKELNPLNADSIVTLKATDADLAKFGLEKPAYTISVDFFKDNSLRRNVFIGERTATGYYATMGAAFDAVFLLSDEAVSHLTAPLTGE